MRGTLIAIFIFGLLAIGVAYWYQDQLPAESTSESGGRMGTANPASVHCTDIQGWVEVIGTAAGGQIGYCHLRDGRVCETWGLLRDNACSPPPGY